MPVVLDIDGLNFTFPVSWDAGKYDDWSFYRNQFSQQRNDIKAVDAIAVSPAKCVYFIEVKDYRRPGTPNPSELAHVIAKKVHDTLAAMLPAKLNATDTDEKRLAGKVIKCVSLCVVAHIELPSGGMPLVDLGDLKQKLKQLLKAVDSHPKIVSMQNMRDLQWKVT